MGQITDGYFLLLFFCIFPASFGQSSSNYAASALDSVFRDQAFGALARSRAGVVYKVPHPANFSGMEASTMRLRSGRFWIEGANFSTMQIPPKVLPLPFVRRLALVYQNLGNWSASYYNSISGYSLASPIFGLLAYDASTMSSSTIKQLDLRINGDPISVGFPELGLPEGENSAKKCAKFGPDGSVVLDEVKATNLCLMTGTGHFAIVVPSAALGHGSDEKLGGKKEVKWRLLGGVSAGGVVGMVLLGLVGIRLFRLVKNKKRVELERRTGEGEVLKSVWVGGFKLPCAEMIRTQPVLENKSEP